MPPQMMLMQLLQAMGPSGNPASRMGMRPPPAPPMTFRDHLRQRLEGLPPQAVEYLMNLHAVGQFAPWGTP
jgi:hypothetical protein